MKDLLSFSSSVYIGYASKLIFSLVLASFTAYTTIDSFTNVTTVLTILAILICLVFQPLI